MQNLLTIEANLLNSPVVKQGLNLTKIRTLQTSIANGKKKRFSQTIELSQVVVSAFNWFKSDAGKQTFEDSGVIWNAEDFALKVFGWQKSYFYKVVKAGELPETTVNRFNNLCNELEEQGEDVNRSLEGLLKWAAQNPNTGTEQADSDTEDEDGSEDGEGGEGGEGGETMPETRAKAFVTFTVKKEISGLDKNVSVRILEDGTIKTANSPEDIETAVRLFMTHLSNQ
ncbi:MAG: hypothetical protein [Podoviridae sp. ctrTa16]|nr:MAG: hypothetical protein [Podoviridae sp. ctrTa16]